MSSQPERIEKQVIALAAADPALTHTQLAKLVNRSTKTIQRIMKKNEQTLDDVDQKLQDVRTQIKEHLPISKRVQILAGVANESENPFARLNAVKYVNELDDIHPQLEREKVRKDAGQQETRPMFVFNPGVQIDFGGVTINQQSNTLQTTTYSKDEALNGDSSCKPNGISEGSDT